MLAIGTVKYKENELKVRYIEIVGSYVILADGGSSFMLVNCHSLDDGLKYIEWLKGYFRNSHVLEIGYSKDIEYHKTDKKDIGDTNDFQF